MLLISEFASSLEPSIPMLSIGIWLSKLGINRGQSSSRKRPILSMPPVLCLRGRERMFGFYRACRSAVMAFPVQRRKVCRRTLSRYRASKRKLCDRSIEVIAPMPMFTVLRVYLLTGRREACGRTHLTGTSTSMR